MNLTTTIEPHTIDHHAAALANVTQLIADNHDLEDRNNQLSADNHRLQVRIELMAEQNTRLRTESIRFRMLLIELATQMTTISLQTVKAQEIVRTVHEIDEQPAPTTQALAKLTEEFEKGNEIEAAGD